MDRALFIKMQVRLIEEFFDLAPSEESDRRKFEQLSIDT
jgi:hypothetical protein